MSETRVLMHGTAVAIGSTAVLLRGPSGAGKSDLALRLLALRPDVLFGIGLPAKAAVLVADDQVWLERKGDSILASAPETIQGKLEVRGIGIVAVPTTASAELYLIIDLVTPAQVPRLPLDWLSEDVLGLPIAVMKLSAFEASSPLKVVLALLGRPDECHPAPS